MELKLTGVARASLEELRLDYEDYLRHRGLPLWERTDDRHQKLVDARPQTAQDVADWARSVYGRGGLGGHSGPSVRYSEIAANGALTLIAVASALLDRQLDAQSRAFEQDGGFTEHLYRRRLASRRRHG